MDVEFEDSDLERLYTDLRFNAGLSRDLVRAFRKLMAVIVAATDERDFYALKSLHFEKLKGERSHQRSMRLNSQWRLIVQITQRQGGNKINVISIEDYHS